MPDALQPPKNTGFFETVQRLAQLHLINPDSLGVRVFCAWCVDSLGGVPKPQEVQQVVRLHEAVAVQVRACGMPAPAVVDVGRGVVIDGCVVCATRKHADAPVVPNSIWMEVEGLRICAVLRPAMGVGGGLQGHNLGQHFTQTSCRRRTSLLHPGEVTPDRSGQCVRRQELHQVLHLHLAVAVEIGGRQGVSAAQPQAR